MHRIALAIIVGVLASSASGVYSLVVNEPCTGYELPGSDDNACPPTCVTCGCCAQAVETISVVVPVSPDIPVGDLPDVPPRVPLTSPRDILHVPKIRVA